MESVPLESDQFEVPGWRLKFRKVEVRARGQVKERARNWVQRIFK